MAYVSKEKMAVPQTDFSRLLYTTVNVVSLTKTNSKTDHMPTQVHIAETFKPGPKWTYKEIANISQHLFEIPKIVSVWDFLLINI